MESAISQRLRIDEATLRRFCVRWRILELAVFGSVLRDDFSPSSDIDVLVRFDPDHDWSVLDHLSMEAELGDLLGRDVDVVSVQALEENANWLTRKSITATARRIYAA